MSVANLLKKQYEFSPTHMTYDQLIESVLSELADGSIDEEPDEFFTEDDGNYTFEVSYSHKGEADTVEMEVSIETDCRNGSISVLFNEAGGNYRSTNLGGTIGEKRRIVDTKMTGVAYCVKYHIEHVSCVLNKITFSPVAEEKDVAQNKNRRSRLYVLFAKKYLPKIGLKINEIKGENTSHVVIYTDEFGGEEGGIEGNVESEYDAIQETLHAIASNIPSAPRTWIFNIIEEVMNMYDEGRIDSEDIHDKYLTLAHDVEIFFKYLKLIGVDWDYAEEMFGEAIDVFKLVDQYNLDSIAEEYLANHGWGVDDIPLLKRNKLISSIVEAVEAIFDADMYTLGDNPTAFTNLAYHIIENPEEEEWDTIDWENVDLETWLDQSDLDDKDKYRFIKAISKEEYTKNLMGMHTDKEWEDFQKNIMNVDATQIKMDI